jgi:broad specificity phosphatase PhoE
MADYTSSRSLAVTARLILIAHASTAALRCSSFPADEPLDEHGKRSAAALPGRLPNADRRLTSPELRTRQTAEALGLNADVEPALRDCDYGSWSGRSFKEICAREPEAVAAWLRAPEAAPHGGESVLGLMQRVAGWMLREQACRQGHARHHHSRGDRAGDWRTAAVVLAHRHRAAFDHALERRRHPLDSVIVGLHGAVGQRLLIGTPEERSAPVRAPQIACSAAYN